MTALNSTDPLVRLSSRDRILLSAKRLFARDGYENTRTSAIVREAATSESQLVKYFGGKQGLLAAVLDRGWAAIVERLHAAPSFGSAAEELLDSLLAMVIVLEQDADLEDLMMLENRREPALSPRCAEFRGHCEQILSRMRERGQLSPDVGIEAACSALVGSAEGLLRAKVIARRSASLPGYGFDEMKRVLTALVEALGPKNAAN